MATLIQPSSSNVGTSKLCPISPTYISTNLLTPEQSGRITIPSVGYQSVEQPALGGKTWGEPLTSYGGIGGLPFLGKRRHRDLYVPRSHRHYTTCLSRYEAHPQPYQVTPTLKSSCRLNDQVLPASFKVELDPRQYLLDLGLERQPYFSHRSIFEVFPRLDPLRADGKGNPVLNDETRQALKSQYYKIYDEPCYAKKYPDNTKLIHQNLAKRKLSSRDQCTSPDTDGTSCKPKQSPTQPPPKRVAIEEVNNGRITGLGPDYSMEDLKRDLGYETVQEEEQAVCPSNLFKEVLLVIDASLQSDGTINEDFCCTNLQFFMHEMDFQLLHDIIMGLIGALDFGRVGEILSILDSEGKRLFDKMSSQLGVLSASRSLKNILMSLTEFAIKAKYADKKSGGTDKVETDSVEQKGPPYKSILKQHSGAKLSQPSGPHGPHLWPCWPPGSNYLLNKYNMQLHCIDQFYPKPSPVSAEAPRQVERKVSWAEDPFGQSRVSLVKDVVVPQDEVLSVPNTGLKNYKQTMEGILPVNIAPAGCDDGRPMEGRFHEVPQFPPLPQEGRPHKVVLPPLSTYLHPTGNRIQDRLGLKFKRAAQKRYQALHPDPVPDPRDWRINHKKYFFYGYHASAFRG